MNSEADLTHSGFRKLVLSAASAAESEENMIRLFKQHYVRPFEELEGMWRFQAEGSEKVYSLPVPGCWEQHPDFLSYRGKGAYTKIVEIPHPGNLRLEFKGVSHTADVYFDGEKIAHHYNAFTPFSAVIKNVTAGTHEITVKVDNTFGEHSALHTGNDYYTYGGITRPVALEFISDVYIKNVHFTPRFENDAWKARLEITVCNVSDRAATFSLQSSLSDVSVTADELTLAADSQQTFTFDRDFPLVTPWSHKVPRLYLWSTVLLINNIPVDDLIDRVGFRTVAVQGNRILLNGSPIFVKGFNRHEDHADSGCALPLQQMAQDMDLMIDCGVNAVRTCHYPNDERFLDLCDERGILVWEENHARGFVLENMLNPNFEKQCEDCIAEMIENHYNHPSIFIWGILNECASETPEGRRMYAAQYGQIRSLDTSRPTTSATCRHFTDICLDLPDVVSFNMYSGWYQDVDVSERNDAEIKWIWEVGGAGKPIIVSEVGAAAIYGYRDRSRCKWSEERQADIIRENLEVYLNDENISGVFIWQFADCRVTEEGGWFATRARCHNNKGVVDEYRRPKMAYDVVREMFSKKL